MKAKEVLKVYCLSTSQQMTDWRSLLSDKYRHALPFSIALVRSPLMADVIAWDGLVTAKLENRLGDIMDMLRGKVILITGESTTLHHCSKFVRYAEFEPSLVVDLGGWSSLPEKMLEALDLCFKKRKHV